MNYAFFFAAASLGMLAACSGLNEPVLENSSALEEENLVEQVIFEAPVIRSGADDGTRASIIPEDEIIHFGWEATDTVGIYPDQGAQVFFSMEDGVGSNVASFNGGGWALRQASTYYSYFPYVGNMYLKRDAIPVSFAGQEQTGVSNYQGARFFLASKGESSQSGSLQFKFKMLNTVIRIRAIGLPAGTYTRMSLTTDEPVFVLKGVFGLEDPDDMAITGRTFSNTLDVSLKDFVLTDTSTEDNPVFIYVTSAPVDLSGKSLTVRFYSDDDSVYKCEKNPTYAYHAGESGLLRCEMTKESVIFYTSSDGNVITPAADAFGEATIVGNEYIGSKGILHFHTGVNPGKDSGEDPGVTQIGDYAFQGCTNLASITIPETVNSLGEGAFMGCSSLSSVNIPDGVTVLEDNVFRGCESLTSIVIPEGVTSIGDYAFENCRNLSGSIVIPENVESIGTSAFLNCSSLSYVTVHAVYPPEGAWGAFEGTNNCVIYVPSENINAYKTTAGWSSYASRICDHVYVEMGNGMKWATTNVGAVGPDEFGCYYAWGMMEPYIMPAGKSSSFIDTAAAIWGGSWRMPTLEEWEALMDSENFEWTWDSVKNGYFVESKVAGYAGNRIFLPAAGGGYWSSSLDPVESSSAMCLQFDSAVFHILSANRDVVFSIRPVFESNMVGDMENPYDSEEEFDI